MAWIHPNLIYFPNEAQEKKENRVRHNIKNIHPTTLLLCFLIYFLTLHVAIKGIGNILCRTSIQRVIRRSKQG